MPLREALFPHADEEFIRLRRPQDVELAGGARGKASGWVVRLAPPQGAEPVATILGDCVGYRVRVGAGSATYLGYHPWYATTSGDDVALAEGNRSVPGWACQLAGVQASFARAIGHEGVDVWQYDAPGDVQHLYVISRAPAAETVEVAWTRAGGAERLRLVVLPRSAYLVTMAGGAVRSLLLKSVNDADGLRTPPLLEHRGMRWGADAACDLLVAPRDDATLEVSVTNLEAGEVEVALGVPAERVRGVATAAGELVPTRAGSDGGLRFAARELAEVGCYTVRLVG
jgi:hypothetical protein